MKNSKNRKYGKIIIIALLLIAATVAAIICVRFFMQETSETNETVDEHLPVISPAASEPVYISETIYDGDEELEPILFSFPFQKDDAYISNKELAKAIDEEMLNELKDRASDFATTIYAIDARNISQNLDNYSQSLQKFLIGNRDVANSEEMSNAVEGAFTYHIGNDNESQQLETEDLIASYIEAVCGSGIKAEVSFKTNKALVWQDLNYFVRGLLELRIYSADDTAQLKSFIPFEIKGGETYYVVVDIGLIPVSSRAAETYKVVSWNEIAYYNSEGEVINLSSNDAEVKDKNVDYS